jgi:hypothetical protein
LAKHLACLCGEITHFDDILADRQDIVSLPPDDPYRAEFEEHALAWQARFQDCRNRRLALPPLPEFPTEAELISAQDAWREKLPFRRTSKVEPPKE